MESKSNYYSSLDKIDPSTKVLIKNLMPLSDKCIDSTSNSLKQKTQTKTSSQLRKGNFSAEEKEKINDTICEYALSNDLSTEQIINHLKSLNIDKKGTTINLDEEDEDSLLYHLSVSVPSRSINSIIKYIINKYCNFAGKNDGNKRPIYTLNLKKEEKFSSDFSSTVLDDMGSPLIVQLTLLRAIHYFCDRFLEKNYKILKNFFEFGSLNDEEYKLLDGKIIINDELKESRDHRTNIFFIKSSFDLGTLFKIHFDKVKLNWGKIREIYMQEFNEEEMGLYELDEKEIEHEWKKFLKEYKVDEICSIRQDRKMIKEYFINNLIDTKNYFLKFFY